MRIVERHLAAIAWAAALSSVFSRTGAAQASGDTTIEARSHVIYQAKQRVTAPAAKSETKPGARPEGAVWVQGFWSLQGNPQTAPRAGWVWVPGRWLQPPAPGAQWDEAHWGWEDGWWTWIPGHWDESTRDK